MAGLGELERAVMDHLWSTSEPQTVRQVHEALATHRELAYTTVMTVLQRLAKKHLVIQQRDDRAHRYLPVNKREELVASLMVDALAQAPESAVAPRRSSTSWDRSMLTKPMLSAKRSLPSRCASPRKRLRSPEFLGRTDFVVHDV